MRPREISRPSPLSQTQRPSGRQQRKDNGNGTVTTYGYDAAGQLKDLVNFAPGGGTVTSQFNYTYDNLGRKTFEYDGPAVTGTKLAGWTYDTLLLGPYLWFGGAPKERSKNCRFSASTMCL